jgi:hypothetical protein
MGGQLDFVSFRLSLLGQRKSVLWSAHPQGVRIHAPLQYYSRPRNAGSFLCRKVITLEKPCLKSAG